MGKLKVEMVPRKDCETCKYGERDAKREPCKTCLRATSNRVAPYSLWKPKRAVKLVQLARDMKALTEQPEVAPQDIPLGKAVSTILDLRAEREALRGALQALVVEVKRLRMNDLCKTEVLRAEAALKWGRG